jgi:uncharacterized repeat protein (TIGR01451 family)
MMTKKLAIRFTIVAVLVTGGLYGIYKAQQTSPAKENVAKNDKNNPKQTKPTSKNNRSKGPNPISERGDSLLPPTFRGQEEGDRYGGTDPIDYSGTDPIDYSGTDPIDYGGTDGTNGPARYSLDDGPSDVSRPSTVRPTATEPYDGGTPARPSPVGGYIYGVSDEDSGLNDRVARTSATENAGTPTPPPPGSSEINYGDGTSLPPRLVPETPESGVVATELNDRVGAYGNPGVVGQGTSGYPQPGGTDEVDNGSTNTYGVGAIDNGLPRERTGNSYTVDGGETTGGPLTLDTTRQLARPVPMVTDTTLLDTATDLENSSGVQRWIGIQSPAISVQKRGPASVQVNRPAKFELLVRNDGTTRAESVVVTDRVPKGTQFLNASPEPQIVGGQLVWQLGAMEPGEEQEIVIQLLPIAEGQIISAAQVTFTAIAAAMARSTRPELTMEIESAPSVLIRDRTDVTITINNIGTGPALNVLLEGDLPVLLTHPLGPALKNKLGTIEAGERKVIRLTLDAVEPGSAIGQVRLRDDVGLDIAKNIQIQVISPQLQVNAKGPRVKYLEREAKYVLSIGNPGTAAAHRVELVANLPDAMKFISADKHGEYDPRTHSVYWGLDELPSNQVGSVSLVLLAVKEGEHSIDIEAHGDLNTRSSAKFDVSIQSVPELFFTISDSADPIEVGADTVYSVEVSNQGTREDTNVIVEVIFPPALRPVAAEPDTQVQVDDQRVSFQPIARLAPGETRRFQVRAAGITAGDVRAAVRVMSDTTAWITKEEGTKVYVDSVRP